MKYVILRREISKYAVSEISCDHMFSKIEALPDKEIIIDFILVYYISNEFLDAYIANKALSTKRITEKNLPLNVKRIMRQ
jgi:hypothetical protein